MLGAWLVSKWSSLACHPIVDDDVQSAWQIISNLGLGHNQKDSYQ